MGGGGGRGAMFGGVLVVGTAAVEAVGTRFLYYQLPLCKVCMLYLVSKKCPSVVLSAQLQRVDQR